MNPHKHFFIVNVFVGIPGYEQHPEINHGQYAENAAQACNICHRHIWRAAKVNAVQAHNAKWEREGKGSGDQLPVLILLFTEDL